MPKPAKKITKKSQPADKSSVKSGMDPTQRKVRIVSLFSGAGGLEIAACQSGMVEAIASTDSNATFLSTVEKNMPTHFPGVRHSAIVADARELKGKTMRDLLGYKPDIVMGGPPCDDYTTLGKRRGTSGEKGPLIFEFLRLVDELRPTAFVFENVPNLTRQFKAGFAQFLSNAAEIGYSTKWSLLKACDYGAPTLRTRVFVIGWHGHENLFAFRFPKATHGISTDAELPLDDDSSLKPYLFTNDVLADLPDVSKANTSVFPNHTGRTHKAETIEQIRSIKPGTSTGKSYRYRAPWAGLTQSLTAGLDNNTKSYIHPRYHREMSVREYARLHLFPDTWVFMGTQSNGLKQVANSVPIPLGNAVLSAVFRFLEESPASLPVNVKL